MLSLYNLYWDVDKSSLCAGETTKHHWHSYQGSLKIIQVFTTNYTHLIILHTFSASGPWCGLDLVQGDVSHNTTSCVSSVAYRCANTEPFTQPGGADRSRTGSICRADSPTPSSMDWTWACQAAKKIDIFAQSGEGPHYVHFTAILISTQALVYHLL